MDKERILQLNEIINNRDEYYKQNSYDNMVLESAPVIIGMGIIIAIAGILAFKFPQYSSFEELSKEETAKMLRKTLGGELTDEEIKHLYENVVVHNKDLIRMFQSDVKIEKIRKNLLDIGIYGEDLSKVSRSIGRLKEYHLRITKHAFK